jgi:hypothetical protein
MIKKIIQPLVLGALLVLGFAQGAKAENQSITESPPVQTPALAKDAAQEPASENKLGKITKFYRADDGSIVIAHGKVVKTFSLKMMDHFSKTARRGDVTYPVAETEKLSLSEDRLTLGWLVRYDACYSSYPCPWVVAVYYDGKIIQKIQGTRFIWDWHFSNKAEQVAVRMDVAPDSASSSYALYDVKSGRVVEKTSSGKALPHWAQGLKEKE